ncbi:MAG: dockerin type I repeat-containing protein [Ruminococcus sp.]|nr:dockerin type I repeat-containing protein [Ruminococcus sp.]
MKTIRRSLSTLLFMLLLFGAATTVHASTQTTNERKTSCLLGDANEDGAVTVSDVTAIQRKIAGFSIAPFNTFTADVDKNGAVEIQDATLIQCKLAGLPLRRTAESLTTTPCTKSPCEMLSLPTRMRSCRLLTSRAMTTRSSGTATRC